MKIVLGENRSAYFESEVFTICDEPLVIEVESPYENLYGVCTIGKSRSVIKVKDGVLKIPPSFLTPGTMSIVFKIVENGNVVNDWNAERVILRELDGEYEVIPEVAKLREEIGTIKKALKELCQILNKNYII